MLESHKAQSNLNYFDSFCNQEVGMQLNFSFFLAIICLNIFFVACAENTTLQTRRIDCPDGIKQVALLEEKQELRVLIEHQQVDKFSEVNTPYELEQLIAGTYSTIDNLANGSKSVSMDCGVRLRFVEQSSVLYFFHEGKFDQAWESD